MVRDNLLRPIYGPFEDTTNSRHLTIVFNLFVFMQIFNMICARKINDEFNIFNGILTNPMFLAVWFTILILQFFMIQYFGRYVLVHEGGLSGFHWMLCIVIGLVTYVINAFLKIVPDKFFPVIGDEDPQDIADAK